MAMSKPNKIIDDSFNMEAEEQVDLEIANYTDEYEIL